MFEGEFFEGFMRNGILVFGNGDVYNGQFFEEKRQGKGEQTWISGEHFKGKWQNDKPREGLMTYKQNDTYEGKFNKNEQRHGKGIRKTEHLTYEGNFEKGKPTKGHAKFDDG